MLQKRPPAFLLLALAACLWLCHPGASGAQPQSTAQLQEFFRPGEARKRFEAWEKRVRQFESVLTATYAAGQLAAVSGRLNQIAADIQTESLEMARRYEELLQEKRRRATESEAKTAVMMELGYGPDELRYAQNVTGYAGALAGRVKDRLAALPPGPLSGGSFAPGARETTPDGARP